MWDSYKKGFKHYLEHTEQEVPGWAHGGVRAIYGMGKRLEQTAFLARCGVNGACSGLSFPGYGQGDGARLT